MLWYMFSAKVWNSISELPQVCFSSETSPWQWIQLTLLYVFSPKSANMTFTLSQPNKLSAKILELLQILKCFNAVQSMWKCCLSVKQLESGWDGEFLVLLSGSKLFAYGTLFVLGGLRVKLNYSKLSEARDALRKMREEQVRDGQKVIRLWRQVLSNYVHKLGDEGRLSATHILSSR